RHRCARLQPGLHGGVLRVEVAEVRNQVLHHRQSRERVDADLGGQVARGGGAGEAVTPLMFMAHEPQMPSRHERRNVSEESTLALIRISVSSTIGPQLRASSSKVSRRGFAPLSGLKR